MISAVCIVILSLGGSLASPIANNYFDSLLSYTLKNQLRILNLDPAGLPDFSTEFKDKVTFVTVKGTANYTSGKLSGLANATRYSECSGPSYSFGQRKVNCTIGLNDVQSHFNGKIKYGKLPQVAFKANANITTTTLFVEITSQPGANVGKLSTLRFQYIGEVQPHFTGLGSSLNKHLKILHEGYKINVKAEFLSTLTNRYFYAFDVAAGQLPMPT